MKNIVNIIITCVFLSIFSSCSDEWLETIPRDLITEDDFWKSRQQLEEAVAGCYYALLLDEKIGNDDNKYNGIVKQMIIWGELRADNITPGGSAIDEEQKIAECNIIASNPFCNWKFFYTAINNCNIVIANADLVKETDKTITDSEIKAYKAEVLALRSLLYFYLVRTYKEVPLILDQSKTSEQNYYVRKSGESEILNQIILDLNTAYKDALSYYDKKREYNKGRFTKTSIAALLADVYLWMERYQDCIDACDIVMKDKNIVFLGNSTSWGNIFKSGNSNESIFEIQFGNSERGKLNTGLLQSYYSNMKGSAHFTAPMDARDWDITTVFEAEGHPVSTDERLYYTFSITDRPSLNNPLPILKYPSSQTLSANWILYRLSEIYLMKAEALVQNNFEQNAEEALSLINRTYMRAHDLYPALDSLRSANYNTKDKMTDLILREKQRELMFEGKRWYDLLRTSRREKENPMRVFKEFVLRNVPSNYRAFAEGKFKNEWSHYLPIPLSDIETNPMLEQNPFYDTGIKRK